MYGDENKAIQTASLSVFLHAVHNLVYPWMLSNSEEGKQGEEEESKTVTKKTKLTKINENGEEEVVEEEVTTVKETGATKNHLGIGVMEGGALKFRGENEIQKVYRRFQQWAMNRADHVEKAREQARRKELQA